MGGGNVVAESLSQQLEPPQLADSVGPSGGNGAALSSYRCSAEGISVTQPMSRHPPALIGVLPTSP